MLRYQDGDSSLLMLDIVMETSSIPGTPVTVHRLKHAWNIVVQHHDILRIFFITFGRDRFPIQVVLYSIEGLMEIVGSFEDAKLGRYPN